jgi:hypothetical protein
MTKKSSKSISESKLLKHEELSDKAARTIARGVRKPPRDIHHTSVRKSLAEHGKPAWDAAIAEFKQLYKEKKALKPVMHPGRCPILCSGQLCREQNECEEIEQSNEAHHSGTACRVHRQKNNVP